MTLTRLTTGNTVYYQANTGEALVVVECPYKGKPEGPHWYKAHVRVHRAVGLTTVDAAELGGAVMSASRDAAQMDLDFCTQHGLALEWGMS